MGSIWRALIVTLTIFALFNTRVFGQNDFEEEDDSFVSIQSSEPVQDTVIVEDDDDSFFVGAPPVVKTEIKEEKKKEPVKPIPAWKQQQDWFFEMAVGAFIIVYLVNYLIGRVQNNKIANAWLASNLALFQRNFSTVGENKGDLKLTKDGQSTFRLYATGRMHCRYLLATLELKKRHDLFSVLLDMFTGSQDTVTIDVDMNAEDCDAFVFALVRENKEKETKKEITDINKVADRYVPGQSLPGVVCFSDAHDLARDDTFINSSMRQIINDGSRLFGTLHITDLNPYVKGGPQRLLRAVYRLPSARDMQSLSALMEMTVFCIDLLASTRLSERDRKNVEKQRAKLREIIDKAEREKKQEELRKKKAEERQKEEERVMKLSKEQQMKIDEKERKAKLKNRMPKMKVMHG